MRVVLVPHVTLPESDDWNFMRQVVEESDLGDALCLIPPNLSAQELKWAIGQVRVFAGCRMHSTIAAFSMGVPTVSLSYSAKSIGLNREFFEHMNYVVGAGDMTAKAVVATVIAVLNNRDAIRARIQNALPDVQNRAVEAAQVLLRASWQSQ